MCSRQRNEIETSQRKNTKARERLIQTGGKLSIKPH